MFYAILSTVIFVILGVGGFSLALIDIDKYNFGLYLCLLSVVGSTVSVAACVIAPSMCTNPRWVEFLIHRYEHKVEPIMYYCRSCFAKPTLRRNVTYSKSGPSSIRRDEVTRSYRSHAEPTVFTNPIVEFDLVTGSTEHVLNP